MISLFQFVLTYPSSKLNHWWLLSLHRLFQHLFLLFDPQLLVQKVAHSHHSLDILVEFAQCQCDLSHFIPQANDDYHEDAMDGLGEGG